MKAATLMRVCDHTFYLDGRPLKAVVDLGMNKGAFTDWIIRNTEARCVGVEPVPALFQALPRGDRIEAEQAAVGVAAGQQVLCVPPDTCASFESAQLTEDGERIEVKVTTLAELMRAHGLDRVDLVKIDIEGAEIDLLAGLSPDVLARIDQMTVEFHDFIRPSDRPRVAEVVARIRDSGFYVVNFGRRHFTDVMFLNRDAFDVGLALRTRVIAVKYARGARRMLGRLSAGPSHASRAAKVGAIETTE